MARMTPTWVYAITCREHVKIGIATHVEKRLKGLQGSNPFKVEIYGTRLFADYPLARLVETELHDEFAAHRGFGEWFAVDPEAVMISLRRRDEHRRESLPPTEPIGYRPPVQRRHPTWTDAQWRIVKALTF